jgi:hypothetical protein
VTTQAGDRLLHDGKEMWMRSLPLESYWEAHPPRPYLLADSSASWRGYIATWRISDESLHLVEFTARAWKTSGNWIGNEALDKLWRVAGARWSEGSVQSGIDKLSHLPATASPAEKRSAGIVLMLGQKLLAKGELNPTDSQQLLYNAAVDASWACFTKEELPVTIETLFPGSNGRVLAEWYTGALHLPEGKVLKYEYGPPSVFEFDRIIDIRRGRVVGEHVRRNDPPPYEDPRSI